jgi:hypothetical protein
MALRRPNFGWEGSIKMGLTGIGCEAVEGIEHNYEYRFA